MTLSAAIIQLLLILIPIPLLAWLNKSPPKQED